MAKITLLPFVLTALLSTECSHKYWYVNQNGEYYDRSTISFLKECSSIQENYFAQYDRSFLLKTKQFDSTKNQLANNYIRLSGIPGTKDSIYLTKSQIIDILFHIDRQSASRQTHEQTIGHIEREIQQWRWLLKYVEASSAENPLIDLVLPKQKNDCEYMSLVMADVLNELGIETFREYTPLWQDRPKSHYWCVTTDSLGVLQPFTPPENNLREDWESDLKYAGKVYRLEEKRRRNTPVHLVNRNEFLPDVFRSDMISDQTDRYHETSTIRIPLHQKTKNHLAYLCFFDDNDYKLSPVGWGKIKHGGKVAVFEQVPHNVLLFPAVYEGNQLIPIDNPFIIEASGSIKWFIPGGSVDMVLKRKYPEKRRLVTAAENLIGAYVLGGFDRKGPYDTLGRITQRPIPYPQDLVLNNHRPYHYYKVTTTRRQPLNIAEIQLMAPSEMVRYKIKPMDLPSFTDEITASNDQYSRLTPEVLSTGNSVWDAVDDNVLTYTGSSDLIFYFNNPTIVTAIRYLPRNANNIVTKNDDYVLYYYDKGWVEFDERTASSNCIRFDNVPGNTIYLLSDITGGKEELPFYYLDGKQVFINNSDPYD